MGAQLVGLNMKLGRSMTASIARRSVGIPSRMRGSSPVVTVSREVWGATSILPLMTTVPRLNGPATTGTTIDSPNGAPSYGPVRYMGAAGAPAWGTWKGYGPGPALAT